MLTVIIPSRNEMFLSKTIEDILKKARGEIEVIAVLDGYWPSETKREKWSTPAIIQDDRVTYIHFGEPRGLRVAINAGVAIAKGDYVMKVDGHCLFDEGFDVKLAEDCEDNWVVIPRRYSLDAENWCIDMNRPIRDYHYMCFPDPNKAHDVGMHGVEWPERTKERSDSKYDIDDTMSFQGSCWFMKKTWFESCIKQMDENPIFAKWAQEPTEIGCKTWLSGGAVKVNKKTYYAHLHKGKTYGRGYIMDEAGVIAGHKYSAQYWMNNQWPYQIHKIDWLIEKFMPVPTWPLNRDRWVAP